MYIGVRSVRPSVSETLVTVTREWRAGGTGTRDEYSNNYSLKQENHADIRIDILSNILSIQVSAAFYKSKTIAPFRTMMTFKTLYICAEWTEKRGINGIVSCF